jgi:hypothetical protein
LSQRQEQQMMKHPTKDDFTVMEVFESGVTVLFEPTQSFYTFYRLPIPTSCWPSHFSFGAIRPVRMH